MLAPSSPRQAGEVCIGGVEEPFPGKEAVMTVRSVGVEEELLLVEPGTGQPLAVAEMALRSMDSDQGHGEGAGRGTLGIT